MEEPETIELEREEIKREYEIKVDDNKLRIEMNDSDIIFSLIIDLSFNKYIQIFKHDEFREKFKISEHRNIKEVIMK